MSSVVEDMLQFSPLTAAQFHKSAKQDFTFVIDYGPITSIAAGTEVEGQFQTRSDSWFVLLAQTAVMRDSPPPFSAVIPDRPFTIQLEESGGGRNLYSDPADFDTVFGTAQRPALLGVPFWLAPKSTFIATISVLNTGVTTFHLRLGFVGFKVFTSDMGVKWSTD